MRCEGTLLLLSALLLLATVIDGQVGRKPPNYLGTAVFNSPSTGYQALSAYTQYPAESDSLQLKVNELLVVLKKYFISALDSIKTRFQSGEPFVVFGLIGGALLYAFNLVKSMLTKVTTSMTHCLSGKSDADDAILDAVTSRVWTAVADGQCLQKAACQLGRQTGQYNNAYDAFRILRQMPSPAVVEAFLRSADGYDDCSQYHCD